MRRSRRSWEIEPMTFAKWADLMSAELILFLSFANTEGRAILPPSELQCQCVSPRMSANLLKFLKLTPFTPNISWLIKLRLNAVFETLTKFNSAPLPFRFFLDISRVFLAYTDIFKAKPF